MITTSKAISNPDVASMASTSASAANNPEEDKEGQARGGQEKKHDTTATIPKRQSFLFVDVDALSDDEEEERNFKTILKAQSVSIMRSNSTEDRCVEVDRMYYFPYKLFQSKLSFTVCGQDMGMNKNIWSVNARGAYAMMKHEIEDGTKVRLFSKGCYMINKTGRSDNCKTEFYVVGLVDADATRHYKCLFCAEERVTYNEKGKNISLCK